MCGLSPLVEALRSVKNYQMLGHKRNQTLLLSLPNDSLVVDLPTKKNVTEVEFGVAFEEESAYQ